MNIISTVSDNNTNKLFKLLLLVLFSLLLTVAIAGCGEDDVTGTGNNQGNGNGNGGNGTSDYEVTMVGHSFSPSNLTVPVGATVVWINESDETHTVTSGSDGQHDELFDSGNVAPGGQYSYEFQEAGTYDYYCIPHYASGMTGTITVTNDNEGSTGDTGNDNPGGDNGGNDSGY